MTRAPASVVARVGLSEPLTARLEVLRLSSAGSTGPNRDGGVGASDAAFATENDLLNLKPGDMISASKMSGWTSPQAGDEATTSLTWTVGAVTQEAPLGFLGVTLVPEMIVSDAVFDGLSDRMEQLGPTNNGHMTVKSDDPDAARCTAGSAGASAAPGG